MPLTHFICPDKETIAVKDCLKQCRMAERCCTKNYLLMAGAEREYPGMPSVTTLCNNGPRLVWLQLRRPYAVNPKDRAFAILGTGVNKGLDEFDHAEQITAERLKNAITHGEFDLYEQENGIGTLTDRKVWGSYKVKKVLSGDDADVKHQLNMYRLLIEEVGFKVDKMQIEAIVRDGGTWMAKKQGVLQNHYLIPIERMSDDEVRLYFKTKSDELTKHLETGTLPRLCNPDEAWDGRRCEGYCPVAEYCIKNGDNHYAGNRHAQNWQKEIL